MNYERSSPKDVTCTANISKYTDDSMLWYLSCKMDNVL